MNIEIWENSELGGEINTHSYRLSSFEFQDDKITTLRTIEDDYVAQMKDNGNCIKIDLRDKKFKFEYHEAVELLFLLMSNMDQEFEFRESKIIKKF
jgi:hypothetical protein